jgi:hypothetical protein
MQQATHRSILQLAAQTPTVYLPSHEWNAERRLLAREPIRAARLSTPRQIPLPESMRALSTEQRPARIYTTTTGDSSLLGLS